MSAQWTTKYAIMRDLSMVQGCVPVDVEGAVAAGEKPPAYNIVEETEEEFYRHHCAGEGDFATPDVNLISQMLDLVREIDVTSDPEEDIEKPVKPVKPKMSPPKYIPKMSPFSYKKKDSRKQVSKKPSESLRDTKSQITTEPNLSFIPLLSPFSYKKKECIEQDLITKVPSKTTICRQEIGKYVPSSQADEYYKKYLERSKIRDDLESDIWKRVERQIKEIDEKRKLEEELQSQLAEAEAEAAAAEVAAAEATADEAEATAAEATAAKPAAIEAAAAALVSAADVKQSPVLTEPTGYEGNKKLDVVRLPQYRHLLTGECIVCKVFLRPDVKYHLRFGGVTDHGDQVTAEPDLAGITQMLRMVNNVDSPNDEDTVTKTEDIKEKAPKETVTIWKLDPNAEEFIHKSVPSSDPDVNNIKKENIKACTGTVVKTVNPRYTAETSKTAVENNRSSGDKHNDEEKIRIAEKLKIKIIKSSNAKTLQHKIEKNVAIAALLRLHSTPPDSDTPKIASVVNPPKEIRKDAASHASSSPNPTCFEVFHTEYFKAPTCTTKVNVDIHEVKTTSAEVHLPQPIDQHIQESVNKVINWLNKPETPKPTPPMVCLEPAASKKKEASSSSSSSSVKTTKQPISPSPRNFVKLQPISAIPSFVPSSYASDLVKKYEEKNKEQEAQVDIWTKLKKMNE